MCPILRLLLPATLALTLAACAGHDTQSVPNAEGATLIRTRFDHHARSYWLYAPRKTQNPQPLLIVLHGTGGNGAGMIRMGHFAAKARSAGFILAAPNALGRAFNDGSGRISARLRHTDDVGFIKNVIEAVRTSHAVSGVYIAGFGTGGGMAQRLAVAIPGMLKGVASVAGHLWISPDTKQARAGMKPVSVLLVFGTDDPLDPITGGPVHDGKQTINTPSPLETTRRWARLYGCSTTVSASASIIHEINWAGCRDGVSVMLLTVAGLGHYWPGGDFNNGEDAAPIKLGPYIGNVKATDIIWDFFSRHTSRGHS